MQLDPFNLTAFKAARARALRRAQLWHASRLAVPDAGAWRRAWPAIGRAIEARLAEEFPAT